MGDGDPVDTAVETNRVEWRPHVPQIPDLRPGERVIYFDFVQAATRLRKGRLRDIQECDNTK